jgi:putative endonuclease
MEWWYIYLLLSSRDNKWYTGYTNNLKNRIAKHNSEEVFSTKNRRPFKLIYSEACLSKLDAQAREKYLKSGMGKRYLKNRLKSYFNKKDENF